MTVATSRLIIVCPPEQRDSTNATLNALAGTAGEDVMTSTLTAASDPTGPAVAYWCSWTMDDAKRNEIRAAIRAGAWRPRLSNAELTVHEPPSAPTWGSQRVYLFNGLTWDPDAVILALGLARPGSNE